MRLFGIITLAAVLTACIREPLFPGPSRQSLQPGGSNRPSQTEDSLAVPPGEHVYLTAVRYPDGYDWELDTCAVEGTVLIDLYRDGEIVRSIPAGPSVHPDMHRFTGGHLYTDCSSGNETVVSRDGTELFRFEGRESMRGFLVREDGVHTLGQDRDGNGFTYRVDGRVIFRSETGTVRGGWDRYGPAGGALTESGEDVFYACTLPLEKGQEGRIMRNAECFRTVPEAGNLLDFALLDGKLCKVQKMPRRLVLDVEGEETVLGLNGGEASLWCRTVSWNGEILVLVCALSLSGKRFLLQTAGSTLKTSVQETVSDLVVDGSRLGWTVTDGSGNLEKVRWHDGETVSPGPGAFLASSQCIHLHDGHLLLALTGRDGTPNRLLQDGEASEIPFNGYFTSVVVE